jgi:hypothetical protein
MLLKEPNGRRRMSPSIGSLASCSDPGELLVFARKSEGIDQCDRLLALVDARNKGISSHLRRISLQMNGEEALMCDPNPDDSLHQGIL